MHVGALPTARKRASQASNKTVSFVSSELFDVCHKRSQSQAAFAAVGKTMQPGSKRVDGYSNPARFHRHFKLQVEMQ
jgi:hypothetical protein